MTDFTLPVEIPPFPWKSGYAAKHLFLGSCFTENIGGIMEGLKFKTDINPFGILYNPVSLADALGRLVTADPFAKEDLFHHGGLWHSYRHHGRFSGTDPDETLQRINQRLETGSRFLKQADFLLITLGTAWVYEQKTTGAVVANCHKVPAREFSRYRLTVTQSVACLREVLEEVWNINPGIRVIFTVSPVRHTRDGAVENQLSKAVLLLACDALVTGFGKERCFYFPAYEIMMDELRDYRFYAADMIHPSPVAVDFIWDKFKTTLFGKADLELSREITQVKKAMEHRPLNSVSAEYRQFLENSLRTISLLVKNHPVLDFSAEIHYFSKQIENGSEK